jgi:hypothetical protein
MLFFLQPNTRMLQAISLQIADNVSVTGRTVAAGSLSGWNDP